MNIETVQLNQVRPYWRNPRNIEKAVDGVVRSITDFSYLSPIVVDGDYVIVAGHVRYRALQKLGYRSVDVVVADHLTAEQARGYRIADNKTAELADWDDDKLLNEIMAIGDPEFARGYFQDRELSEILGNRYEELIPKDPLSAGGMPGESGGSPEGVAGWGDDRAGLNSEAQGQRTRASGADEERDGVNPGEGNGERQEIPSSEPTGAFVEALCPECGEEQEVWVPFEGSPGTATA